MRENVVVYLAAHDWLLYPVVFIGMVALDFVYAEYTKAAADRNSIKASNMASALIMLTGVVTSCYVQNLFLLAPAIVGAWVGTYISMRWGK